MRLVTATSEGLRVFGPVIDNRLSDVSGRWPDLRSALASGAAAIEAAATNAPSIATDAIVLDLPIPEPAKILCVGLNYHDHRAESAAPAGSHPTIFTRYASSLVAAGQPLVRPAASDVFDYEGELAVVIGKRCRAVPVDDALGVVAGYSCFQDGSVRDYQRHSTQFIAGKNFDRSGSFGPAIVTPDEFDATTATLTTTLNGQKVQHAPISDMIYSVAELIAYCSIWTTLEPGDVIATGTPGGVGYARKPPLLLKPGDVVEVSITSVGTLTNAIIAE
jgi:2-keto-4-pentenoate hydratase/2-oxohepta-3-ene-1,7-dioic acid hydratase in catechol pathway